MKKVLAFVILCASFAFGQGSRYDGIVLVPSGSSTAPVPNPSILVCLGPRATVTGGNTCSGGKATLYTDETLTTTASNPLTGDQFGNFHFYAAPIWLTIYVSASGITAYTFDTVLPVPSGLGGTLGQIIDTTTPNNGTTGTTALMLGKYDTSGNIVNCANADAGSNLKVFPIAANIAGSCSAGTTGNACKVIAGKANVTMDTGGVTLGHYVACSGTQAPKATDIGASVPPGQSCAGQALATAGAGAVVTIDTNACAVPASTGMTTVKSAGVAITQRAAINFASGLTCADNAGSAQSDCNIADPFPLANGSAAAPSLNFTNSATTGLFRFGANQIGWTINGTVGGLLGAAGFFMGVPSGSASVLGWCSDATCVTSDTGFSRAAAGEVACGNGTSTDKSCQLDLTKLLVSPTHFAALGTPANGTFVYCDDCQIANPCAGTGTGALAKRLNGAWVCN